MRTFGQSDPATSPGGSPNFLSALLAPSVASVTSSLPSKQETVQYYLMATLAFWVIGGVTLYLILPRNRR